jgi:hypothetical protein
MTFEKSTTATKQQIRNYYADQGYISRVTNNGRVTFYRDGLGWCDGRWQSEYVVDPDGTIRHK